MEEGSDQRAGRPRILVVDDDDGFRAYVCALLEERGFAALEASDGRAALATLATEAPDLIVLDVNLPGSSGYEVCRAIKDELRSPVPVLLVSGDRTATLDRVAGLTIGADDYLVKPFSPDELLARLRALLRRAGVPLVRAGLTPRELQVLELLAEGLSQRVIAERLVITPKTVGTHIEHVLVKLGAHSRAEAVALAYRQKLVAVPA